MITKTHVHITKYGVASRAAEIVPEAKRLASLLSGQNVFSSKTTEYPDGSYVHVARFDHEYVATVVGALPSGKPAPPELMEFPSTPPVLHGLGTDPTLGLAPAPSPPAFGMMEFTKSRQIRGKKETFRQHEPALVTPVHKDLYGFHNNQEDEDTEFSLYSQVGLITPTMYSGLMRDAVQIILAQSISVIYTPGFYRTHGILQLRGQMLLVEVSKTHGVRIASFPVTPLEEPPILNGFSKENIQKYGGFPTGLFPNEWVTIMTPEGLNAVYRYDAAPVLDEIFGWVFNDAGDTAMIVSEVTESSGAQYTQVHTLEFYTDITGITVRLVSDERKKAASPEKWTESRGLNDWGQFPWDYSTVDKGASRIQEWNSRVTEWYDENYATLMSTDSAFADRYQPFVHTPVPGMPKSSSWNQVHTPIWFYTRRRGESLAGVQAKPNTGVRTAKRFKFERLHQRKLSEVDAPIHVTCIDNEFHVISYYWALYPVAHFGMTPLDGGAKGKLEEKSILKLTRSYYGPLLGVPPTVYTTKVDERRFGASTSVLHYAGWGLPNAVNLPMTAAMTKGRALNLTMRNWHMHDEIVLPHLCREGYIHNSYSYRGLGLMRDKPETDEEGPPKQVGICGAGLSFAIDRWTINEFITPVTIPPTSTESVERLMKPVTAEHLHINWLHFKDIKPIVGSPGGSNNDDTPARAFDKYSYGPQGFPYSVPGASIPQQEMFRVYGWFNGLREMWGATDNQEIRGGAWTPEYTQDLAQRTPGMSPDAISVAGLVSWDSDDGIYKIKQVPERSIIRTTASNVFATKFSSEASDELLLADMAGGAIVNPAFCDTFIWDWGEAVAQPAHRFVPVHFPNTTEHPSVPYSGDIYNTSNSDPNTYVYADPDESTVRVFCPGLALEDGEPADPYIPEHSNSYLARMLSVKSTAGASMAYSTIGAFSLVLKHDTAQEQESSHSKEVNEGVPEEYAEDECYGFGALPAGITITMNDIIGFIGELKDG